MNLKIRNPHSVLAALQTRPSDVLEIALPGKGSGEDAWEQVLRLAEKNRVRVQKGGARANREGSRDPGDGRVGAEAVIRERAGIPVEELFQDARERAGGHGIWLALDSLQDPHNVGAIFRTASFFGVQGILMTQERSAPLTATVYDVASGGVEFVPFTEQINLQRAFEVAKEAGLWILGTSEHANDDLGSIERDRPWLVVLGNEEKGMRRLTEESCDLLCRITPRGQTHSLNVSVAAGVILGKLSAGFPLK